jgi:transcriptional regulator with XRE-family HTH domain
VDISLVIRQRLEQLGLEQRDLAAAAQVTESYISQLLTRRKVPPAPHRTDIYDKLGRILKLPNGQLARLADLQRQENLKRKLAEPPAPLFKEVRELVLRKCKPDQRDQIEAVFDQQPFGELERLVTQKLLAAVKRVAQEELENEKWLRRLARLARRSYEEMRVTVLEFLDTDVLSVSLENCVGFLDPLIESWEMDLNTFGIEVVLNRRVSSGRPRRFGFMHQETDLLVDQEPGLKEFLRDASLSGDASEEEINFLKSLCFKGKRPTAIYYYRELQNLRDPIHFRPASD